MFSLVFKIYNFWFFGFFAIFWFVFISQSLNPILKKINFFVCASLCIVVNNFTIFFFSILWLLIKFFNVMLTLKIALLVFFPQVFLQSHHVYFYAMNLNL
jgi:hypothetical protein